MSNKTPRYAQAFRDQMVELVRSGRKPSELSKEFGCHTTSILGWVRQSAIGTLRFVWHLTTVACATLILYITRGQHLSWVVFVVLVSILSIFMHHWQGLCKGLGVRARTAVPAPQSIPLLHADAGVLAWKNHAHPNGALNAATISASGTTPTCVTLIQWWPNGSRRAASCS